MGVDIGNFDYYVQPEKIPEIAPSLCVDGNISTMDFIAADLESISSKARYLLDFFKPRGGYILSSGCEIPLNADPVLIKEMCNVAKNAN